MSRRFRKVVAFLHFSMRMAVHSGIQSVLTDEEASCMSTKKRKRKQKQATPRLICGWCGKRIDLGEESDNLYEPDDAYAEQVPAMAHVHKYHVREEDHPLYDVMPDIVFNGVPESLKGVYPGF
jgi:transcription elongation factor Elf1